MSDVFVCLCDTVTVLLIEHWDSVFTSSPVHIRVLLLSWISLDLTRSCPVGRLFLYLTGEFFLCVVLISGSNVCVFKSLC